ncbi:MAG: OmpP1/FadL family transporter [Flavobacteriales bacterium]
MFKKITTLFIVLISSITLAQQGTTSPYSYYGIGEITFKGNAENRAMGGLSILSDSIHLNLLNPAGLADLKLVNFSAGVSYKYNKQATTIESQKTSTTTFDFLAVGLPVSKKFGVSFGLIPYTSVGYKLFSETETSNTEYKGKGGLNKVFLGLGYQINKNFNVGVEVNYNFGNIENTKIHQQDDIQYGTLEVNKSDLLGFSFNFGASYKAMVSKNLQLASSITYTPETNFTSENTRIISTPVDFREFQIANTDFTFPSKITLGLGIGKPKNWFVGAEYTNLKTSNLVNNTVTISDIEYNDASKFRLGGFYIPNYNTIGQYWKRIVYRAGMRVEETGISINGEAINEFGISFGVGLPVGRLFSNMNLGFEFGKRGTKKQGLVQENFFNTIISLSLNDKWFEKRYYD